MKTTVTSSMYFRQPVPAFLFPAWLNWMELPLEKVPVLTKTITGLKVFLQKLITHTTSVYLQASTCVPTEIPVLPGMCDGGVSGGWDWPGLFQRKLLCGIFLK